MNKRWIEPATLAGSHVVLDPMSLEHLGAIAVEFRTHWHNRESRAAIARLGAKQDGVLRNHTRTADGIYRDTAVFSIIDQEWPAVRQSLIFRLGRQT